MSELSREQQSTEAPSVAGELRLLSSDNHRLSDEQLNAKAAHWREKLSDPDVSPRGREEIDGLLDRIEFEIRWRRGDFQPVTTPDYMPAEWGEDVA